MANFATILLEMNIGTNASPTWANVTGANRTLRWYTSSSAGLATSSATWPSAVRPTTPTGVDYAYAYEADATGLGVLGNGSVPAAFSGSDYRQARWNWDNVGTFASAPIFTAFSSSAHLGVTRGDRTILGGHTSDTGSTARSYLKGQAFGQLDSVNAPTSAPSSTPSATDGTNGSQTPTSGPNWLSSWQSLQAGNDFITCPVTPAATTANQWSVMFRLFMGPNMATNTYQPVTTLQYTYT